MKLTYINGSNSVKQQADVIGLRQFNVNPTVALTLMITFCQRRPLSREYSLGSTESSPRK